MSHGATYNNHPVYKIATERIGLDSGSADIKPLSATANLSLTGGGTGYCVTAAGLKVTAGTTAAAITAATTLKVEDSGATFTVAKGAAYTITLPTAAAGLKYKFVVLDAGANIVTITAGAAHLYGCISIVNVSTTVAGHTSIGLASGGTIGDWVQFEGIDATHYLVTGACTAAADITINA